MSSTTSAANAGYREMVVSRRRQKTLHESNAAAYQWQYDKADLKYCPRCGALFTLEDIDIPGQPQLVCHACKFVFYLDPKLVVLAIVTFGSRILLLKRAKEPGKGKWALLGGFVERGEDPFAALKREAQEETGIEITIEKIFKVNAFPDAGMVQLIFEATALNGKITTNAESFEGRFFSWEEMPWAEMAFESTRETLHEFVMEKRNGANLTSKSHGTG